MEYSTVTHRPKRCRHCLEEVTTELQLIDGIVYYYHEVAGIEYESSLDPFWEYDACVFIALFTGDIYDCLPV